ncbi:MAG TPA: hypothetical protein VF198_09820 [Vicinamibacterales bacterium]
MQQRHVRFALIAVLVAVTLVAAGFLWGASGRWAAEERLAAAERRAALTEARRLALAGQVALGRLNFGEAAGLFDSARVAAGTSADELERGGYPELAAAVRGASQELGEARSLAAALDQGATGRAATAIAALDRAAAGLEARQP